MSRTLAAVLIIAAVELIGASIAGQAGADEMPVALPEPSALNETAIDTEVAGAAVFVTTRDWAGLPKGTRLVGQYSAEPGDKVAACIVRVVTPDGRSATMFERLCLGRAFIMPGGAIEHTRYGLFVPQGQPFHLYEPPAPFQLR